MFGWTQLSQSVFRRVKHRAGENFYVNNMSPALIVSLKIAAGLKQPVPLPRY